MVRTEEEKATPGKQAEDASKAKIAACLAERAVNGDERSWHHLVDSQESGSEPSATSGSGSSLAMAWGAEPEWQGEWSEALSETAGGSREPEGEGY